MVVFDASILLFVFNKNTPSSVPRAKARVEYLVDRLSSAGELDSAKDGLTDQDR
jgi:hypothetical protein